MCKSYWIVRREWKTPNWRREDRRTRRRGRSRPRDEQWYRYTHPIYCWHRTRRYSSFPFSPIWFLLSFRKFLLKGWLASRLFGRYWVPAKGQRPSQHFFTILPTTFFIYLPALRHSIMKSLTAQIFIKINKSKCFSSVVIFFALIFLLVWSPQKIIEYTLNILIMLKIETIVRFC